MTHDTMRWEGRLARSGARVTRQRGVILDAICGQGGHVSLAEVQARVRQLDPTINRSTVYRSLGALVAAGIVVEARASDGTVAFEIAQAEPHHHLRCQRCGQEQEICAEEVDAFRGMIGQRYGFVLLHDHLTLTGLCAACGCR